MTRSPQTIGEEMPAPRSSAFHATFSVSLQVVGNPVESVRPSPRGPRNRGQFSSAGAEPAIIVSPSRKAKNVANRRGIRHLSSPGCSQALSIDSPGGRFTPDKPQNQ